MRLHRLFAPLVLLVPLVAAAGQLEDNTKKCKRLSTASSAQKIAACTWLIESGNLGKGLTSRQQVAEKYAYAYSVRGGAYRGVAHQQRREGKEDQATASLNRALADYTTVITRYPLEKGTQRVVYMLMERGNVYQAQGDDDRALAEYNEAVRRDKCCERGGDVLYTARGELLLKKRNYDAALRDFETATRMRTSPQNAVAWARAQYLAGQYRQALQTAQSTYHLDSVYEGAANIIGHALVALGDKEQALLQFERAMLLSQYNIVRYQEALAGHGYQVEVTKRYDRATYDALKGCVQAGCRLLE